MIIVTRSYGQLCNQIFLQAHLMVFGIEHGVTVLNPCFRRYSHYFVGTADNALTSYPPVLRYLPSAPRARLLYYMLVRLIDRVSRVLDMRLVGVACVDLEHLAYKLFPDFPQTSSAPLIGSVEKLKGKVCLFSGWYFRCFEGLRRQEETIRAFFSPLPAIRRRVEDVMSPLGGHRQRIGVHIRHGDYAGTRYYFPLECYRSWIDQVRATAGPCVCFLVSSDTTEDLDSLRGDDVYLCPGEAVVDLYCLAGCDFIMGPPSTFNGWAAFYGRAKHLMLVNRQQKIALDDFKDLKFRDAGLKLEDLTARDRERLEFCGVV